MVGEAGFGWIADLPNFGGSEDSTGVYRTPTPYFHDSGHCSYWLILLGEYETQFCGRIVVLAHLHLIGRYLDSPT